MSILYLIGASGPQYPLIKKKRKKKKNEKTICL